MPWSKSKEDMKHFREYTDQDTLVGGRKTVESFSSYLGGRSILCIGSKPPEKGFYKSIMQYHKIPTEIGIGCTIIGGKSLIEKNIKDMDEVSITWFYHGRLDHDVSLNIPHIINMLNKYFDIKESISILHGVIKIYKRKEALER